MSSSGSTTMLDPLGSVMRYSSTFMRTLRDSDAAKDTPPDIIRRFPQAEFYNSKQQFDPDQIGSTVNRLARDILPKADLSGRDNPSVKDDASLQPQQRQSWIRGCGASIQSKTDSQGPSQQSGPTGVTSSSKFQQNSVSNVAATTAGRQPGIFGPSGRTMANALPPQPGSFRTGARAGTDLGQGYASNYRPAREPQDFRQNRPPFGRGRGGLGGRSHEDYDMPSHGNRYPPPLFQGQRQGHFGGGAFGNRGGGFGSRRHAQSTGDSSVPEWFTEGPSDPSMMIELGDELPTSSRSSTPPESLGDENVEECKPQQPSFFDSNNSRPNPSTTSSTGGPVHSSKTATSEAEVKPSGWETSGDKERPASQQADYYLLWSTLKNDLSSSFGESSASRSGDAVSSAAAEITGSKLWSVWKDDMPITTTGGNTSNSGPFPVNDDSRKSVPMDNKVQWQNPSQLQQPNMGSGGGGLNLKDWLENAQIATGGNPHQPQPQPQSQRTAAEPSSSSSALRVTAVPGDAHTNSSGSATSPAPRGLNPNELFAKFSISNGGNNNVAMPPQASQPAPVSAQLRKSPPVTQMMSVEDLERRLMMKKQAPAKSQQQVEKPQESERNQNPRHSSSQQSAQQRSFYDAPPSSGQQQPQPQQHQPQQQQQPQAKPSLSDETSAAPPHLPQQFAGGGPAALQMQLAAAQQAVLNAVAAANNAGGASGAALQQQKMLLANLLQQHQQAGNTPAGSSSNGGGSNNNNGGAPGLPPGLPPFLNMFPPNALAAAAACAAASSPLFYYPQLLQQAQAHAAAARMPGANNTAPPSMQQPSGNPPGSSAPTGTNSGVPLRPPFPMPPPGAFPNFPPLNPTAAASLMAAALSHFQQQQQQQQAGKSSPGPNGGSNGGASGQANPNSQMPFSNPNVAAAAAAAATALMASRMGMNPHLAFPPNQQSSQGQPGFPAASQFPGQGGLLSQPSPMANQMQNNPLNNQQQQQQMQQPQQRPPQPDSPPRARVQSPVPTVANSSSKLNASFIPTQVMMKNPHTINSSPDTPSSSGKVPTQVARANMNAATKPNSGKVSESPNASLSYSSVTANQNSQNTNGQPTKSNLWTAEDLERPFMKATQLRDGAPSANNYSSYPPLHQQSGPGQRTAGIAATAGASATGSGGPSGSSSSSSGGRFPEQAHRVVETAHQFSVADLLRGAANANKAAQSSSASYT